MTRTSDVAMLRIISISPRPLLEVPFLNAGRGPGNFYEDSLPVYEARVSQLPAGIDAIVITSDLQGRERFEVRTSRDEPPRLLGEVLPQRLATEILPALGFPPAASTGVLLAGDFYTVPNLDRRGGSGDVTAVWQAFADTFQWVAGVAGNHDTFGESLEPSPAWQSARRHVHYVHGRCACPHGLSIGGVSGIIGNTRRPHRHTEDGYLNLLQSVLAQHPDVLLLHDGPSAPARGFRGSPAVRDLIELSPRPLVVRGHAHWPEPLIEIGSGIQVLNVDARVVLLRAA